MALPVAVMSSGLFHAGTRRRSPDAMSTRDSSNQPTSPQHAMPSLSLVVLLHLSSHFDRQFHSTSVLLNSPV